MIRQTTTIPVVSPPSAEPGRGGGVGRWVFVLLEVVLLGSIPVLGLLGFRSLLDTRSGEFVVEPGPDDAGWTAAVLPSPISILIDVDEGRVGGAVLVAPNGDGVDGGTLILISGATVVDGRPLSSRAPKDLVEALEGALRLELSEPIVVDSAAWQRLLGGQSVELANPDPVAGSGEGTILVPAGRVTIDPADLAAMSTREPLGSADPEALEFRRIVLWDTLLDDVAFAPESSGAAPPDDAGLAAAAGHLQQIAQGVHRVESLPLDGTTIDAEAAETLLRSAIALPRGHEVGARLSVRIIDRSGGNDLETAARNLGRAGFEVVQISNAVTFDDGPTQVLASLVGSEEEIARLAELADAATVPPSLDAEAASTVTLLLGPEASIARPAE